MFDTNVSYGSCLADYDGDTWNQPKSLHGKSKIGGITAKYKERAQTPLTLDQRRKEEIMSSASLDQYQLSTLRQLMQMRLIEIMISLDQVINPATNSSWTIDDHIVLLADSRVWLYDYRRYLEELIQSKKIKNPEFESWALQDQNFPKVSEDVFINWTDLYGDAFKKAWEGGVREFNTFLSILTPSEVIH